jgi:hypothetical protein
MSIRMEEAGQKKASIIGKIFGFDQNNQYFKRVKSRKIP